MLSEKDQKILMNLVGIVAVVTFVLPHVLSFVGDILLSEQNKKDIEEKNISDLNIFLSIFKLFHNSKSDPMIHVINSCVITSISYVLLIKMDEKQKNNEDNVESDKVEDKLNNKYLMNGSDSDPGLFRNYSNLTKRI